MEHLALGIQNAEEDPAGMQVDAALVLVELSVESHLRPPPSYGLRRGLRRTTLDGSFACQASKPWEEASISIKGFNRTPLGFSAAEPGRLNGGAG
jgi:hypothetical protein